MRRDSKGNFRKKHPLILRYLKIHAREKREVFRFVSPHPIMNNPNPEYEKRIREALSEQCIRQSRKPPIRGEVAIEFSIEERFQRSEALGKFIKSHNDMLYPPKARNVPLDFPGLNTLLQDDSQIDYVSARVCDADNKKSGWSIRVLPISLISEWCKLIETVEERSPFEGFHPFDFDVEMQRAPCEFEFEDDFDEDFLRDFIKQNATTEPELLPAFRSHAQFVLLKRCTLDFQIWSSLFKLERRFKKQRFQSHIREEAKLFEYMHNFAKLAEKSVMETSEHIIKLNALNGFIPVPSFNNTRQGFIKALQEGIKNSPFKNPKIGDWRLPLSVSCFYRPSKVKKSSDFDLDNISRFVMREVVKILRPPLLTGGFGIHHFECKRIRRGDSLDSGEIGFFFQNPYSSKHFLEVLDFKKRSIVKTLKKLEGWEDCFEL